MNDSSLADVERPGFARQLLLQFASGTTNFPLDRTTFFISGSSPSYAALSDKLINAFSTSDARRTDWIGRVTSSTGETYYFSNKYSSPVQQAEYSTVLRLAEQYLIRAEARAMLDNISGAYDDINVIRKRAGLGELQIADKTSALAAIASERQLELFTEWGHRWLDLKRTGRLDAELSPLKPEWKPEAALYPIPEEQILNSPISQNAGY